jgi:hypothetical protein
MTDTQKSNNN